MFNYSERAKALLTLSAQVKFAQMKSGGTFFLRFNYFFYF